MHSHQSNPLLINLDVRGGILLGFWHEHKDMGFLSGVWKGLFEWMEWLLHYT